MATRRITTRLAVEGEAQYRQAMQQVNSELRALESSSKLVSNQYKENANSLEALTAKSKALADTQATQGEKVRVLSEAYQNAQASVQAYEKRKEELTASIQANEKALEELKNTQGDTTAEEKKLTEETERLKAELDQNNQYLAAAERGANDWQGSLNRAQIQLNDTNREIEQNARHLKEAEESVDGCATSIDEFGNKVDSAGDSLTELHGILAAGGVVAMLKGLADGLWSCIESFIEFESTIAGVKRTVGGTADEIATISDALKGLALEIPITTTELGKIAETAGQLGIAQENVLAFTEVMAKLGTATDITAEEAASMLAQFANITNLDPGDYERMGSVIAELGDATATTASKVVGMSQGMAASASIAGFSQTEIMALAAAVGSLGIETQAGSSSMSKLISTIQVAVETGDDLDDFASVANMSATEFAQAWGNEPIWALNAFVQGLNDTERNGQSAIAILSEMGLSEVRLSRAVLSLAESGDLLSNTIQQGNRAWDENVALNSKAATMYGTTESRMVMLGNAMNNVKVSIGDQLNPALNKLIDLGTSMLVWVDDFLGSNDLLVPVLVGLGVALGTLVVGVTAYTVVMPLASKVTAAFSAALASVPILGQVAAIVGLVTALGIMAASYDDGIVRAKELTTASRAAAEAFQDIDANAIQNAESIEATAVAAQRYVDLLDDLHAKAAEGDLSTGEWDMYRNIVGELNGLVPDLNLSIDEQTGLIDTNTDAIRRSIDAWKDQAIQQGRTEALTEKYKQLGAVEVEYANNLLLAAEAQRDAAEATARYDAAIERINELMTEANAAAKEHADTYGEAIDPMSMLTSEYYELYNSLADINDEIYLYETQMNEANKAAETSWETLEGLNTELEREEEALALLTGGLLDNTEALEGMTEAEVALYNQIEQSIFQMDALQAAYNESFEAARESIDKQIGLFDTFEAEVTMSTANMVEAWQTQAENVRKYNENLAISSKYLSADLIAAWSDGSTESAGYIAAFTDDLNELIDKHGEDSEEVRQFVDDFNGAYADTQIARDEFASNVATMETDFENSMTAIQTKLQETVDAMNQQERAAASANNTLDGMVNVYNDRMQEMYNLGAALGQSFMDGYNSKMAIRSPSREMAKAAEHTIEPLVQRFELARGELRRLGTEIGDQFQQGYETSLNMDVHLQPAPTAASNVAPVTARNQANINIYPQSMSDAEVQRMLQLVDTHFGGKATVNFSGG